METYNVRLTIPLARKARRIGDGNMGEGIRRVLISFDEQDIPILQAVLKGENRSQ